MIAPIEQVSSHLKSLLDSNLSGDEWDSRRLFHGRGRCYNGFEQLTVDLFYPVVFVTFFKPIEELIEAGLIDSLSKLAASYELEGVVLQRRYLEGAPTSCVWGTVPAKTYARRGELQFPVHLEGRQNVGFFLDMEPGRQWLEVRAKGKNILNLFAYTCAFSAVAQAAGAAQIVNVDMSKSALSQGRDTHRFNQQSTDNVKFLGENILKSWSRIRRPGPYDVAIIDPPSYQPGSFVAEKDYAKLLRRIPEFMKPGGDLLVCLNSPELGSEFISELMKETCTSCELVERLPSHPDFPDQSPDKQLKLFHFKYCG